MLTVVRGACVVFAAMTVAIVSVAGVAVAQPGVECTKSNPRTGTCLLWTSVPESSGTGSVSPSGSVRAGGDAPSPNPCTYAVADPQPWLGHPVWAGQRPEDGKIWMYACPRPAGFGSGVWSGLVFVPNGAGAPAGPPVDPRVLAQQAIDSMVMRAPQVGLAPPPGSSSGLVGLPVWMWVERGEQFTGPTWASASAGGVTVTAVGEVTQVVWDMGDGNSVSCGIGTPYRPGVDGASPDCGYRYATASTARVPGSGAWPVTATSTWTITWSGGGQSGTETMTLSSTTALRIGELHVLNQDGGSR